MAPQLPSAAAAPCKSGQQAGRRAVNLATLADRLAAHGRVERTPYLLRCQLHDPAGIALTLFPDGRALIHGLADAGRAKSIYARFIGL